MADLDRALSFYCGVLGFELMQRYAKEAAFVSAGGYHHHIGLNTWESAGGSPPAPGTTGLYHLAILYPTRAALADALRRVLKAGIALDGASDHGVSEALYLRDYDENGVELYWDKPREQWPVNAGGRLAMFTRRLDVQALLALQQAVVGLFQSRENAQQRGLPGAVAADQADPLAGLQGEIGVRQQGDVPEGKLGAGEGEQGHGEIATKAGERSTALARREARGLAPADPSGAPARPCRSRPTPAARRSPGSRGGRARQRCPSSSRSGRPSTRRSSGRAAARSRPSRSS